VPRGWDDDRALEELGREYDGELERADEEGRETEDEGELTRDDGRETELLEE
jgi:hypothetical protein